MKNDSNIYKRSTVKNLRVKTECIGKLTRLERSVALLLLQLQLLGLLVRLLGLGVVGRKPEHLLEVRERPVYVILVVQTEAADIDGVGVHTVESEHTVGGFLGLGVSAEEGETLGTCSLQGQAVGGDF